jgi:Calcineurin-like phosphoesterase
VHVTHEVGKTWLLGLLLFGCGRTDTTVVTPPPEVPLESPARGAAGTSSAPVAAAPASGVASPAPAAPPPAASAAPPAPAAAPPAASAPSLEAFRRTAPGRLIAIGDLHGDVAATRAALRLGGAIDASDRWIGGNLTLVQTGDQLDRGDEERQIVDLFIELEVTAKASGGQVIALDGNHEVMNVQGDYRYVTPGGIGAFAGVSPRSPLAGVASAPFQDRAAAFLPGGAYALELAKRDIIAVVGDSVFVHGGVLPAHVSYGIDRINSEARAWMRGNARRAPDSVAAETAPIWVRDYSLDPVSAHACAALGEVLAALKVSRMVVGHTVQSQGISSACDERVYRIDVGLSRYYGQNPIQVLELQKGKIRILSAPREASGSR